MTVAFYDMENILSKMSRPQNRAFRLDDIMDGILTHPLVDEVLEHRAYCTWTRPLAKRHTVEMDRLGIHMVPVRRPMFDRIDSKVKLIKNFADLYIFMDALDFAYTNPAVTCFVFVSLDSDFTILADRLHQMGKQVLLFQDGYHLPPDAFRPKVPKPQNPNAAKHLGQMFQAQAKRYGSMKDFDRVLRKVLEKCEGDEIFETETQERGIDLNTVYQQMKNGYMHISYKTGGIKQMPAAFAAALEDTDYWIVRKDARFFLLRRGCLPEGGEPYVPPEPEPAAEPEHAEGDAPEPAEAPTAAETAAQEADERAE